MTRHNCPNCGAPIESAQCPYCGTVFYDFTVIDSDNPTYIRVNMHGHQMVFKAVMQSVEINMRSGISSWCGGEINMLGGPSWYEDSHAMDAIIEFMILPDDDGVLMKRTELKGENGCQST